MTNFLNQNGSPLSKKFSIECKLLLIVTTTLAYFVVFRLARENSDNGKNYFILLMLTDGCIMDMPETSEAIVKVSNPPQN